MLESMWLIVDRYRGPHFIEKNLISCLFKSGHYSQVYRYTLVIPVLRRRLRRRMVSSRTTWAEQ
jgi:hypothetical protein